MLSQLVILCPFREKRYDQNYELVQSMSFMILSQSIINSKSKVIILSVSEVKTRINLLKEECKKRNANIKPNVLSILEKERQNLIEKKAHDAKLNPFK